MLNTVLVATLSLFAQEASSERWILLGWTDQEVFGIEKTSIRRSGDITRLQGLAVRADLLEGSRYTIIDVNLDCSAGTGKVERVGFYDPDGQLLSTRTAGREFDRLEGVPHTPLGQMFFAVCRGGLKLENEGDEEAMASALQFSRRAMSELLEPQRSGRGDPAH